MNNPKYFKTMQGSIENLQNKIKNSLLNGLNSPITNKIQSITGINNVVQLAQKINKKVLLLNQTSTNSWLIYLVKKNEI